MKKVLLTAMALLTIASTSVFGMYGNGDSWIDFLAHGNQFRARMDQLGFTLGNGTIKGTFGFKSNSGWLGNIISAGAGFDSVIIGSTISAGIGYTSDMFGIGLGYNYTYVNKDRDMHTPVLTVNALNDNLRIAVPVQVTVGDKANEKDYLGIRTDIQLRYYTGIDALNAIRFYVNYGQKSYNNGVGTDYEASSLALKLRLYFLNTALGNVNINPYIEVKYATALKGNSADVNSWEGNAAVKGNDTGAYNFSITPVLGLGANSDLVSVWFEPSLGYSASGDKYSSVKHQLAWGAYAELYVTPVKDLEWYFEMNVNNYNPSSGDINYNQGVGSHSQSADLPVYFETSTGITWYLPSLNGAE